MLNYYIALKAYKLSQDLDASHEVVDKYASELKAEFDKLADWEKDMLMHTCCAEVSDVLY